MLTLTGCTQAILIFYRSISRQTIDTSAFHTLKRELSLIEHASRAFCGLDLATRLLHADELPQSRSSSVCGSGSLRLVPTVVCGGSGSYGLFCSRSRCSSLPFLCALAAAAQSLAFRTASASRVSAFPRPSALVPPSS